MPLARRIQPRFRRRHGPARLKIRFQHPSCLRARAYRDENKLPAAILRSATPPSSPGHRAGP
jgi:hypothetical protein